MPASPVVATVSNNTAFGRRLNAALSALRSARNELAGLDMDVTAMFRLYGYDPAAPTPDASQAVCAAAGLPSVDHLPAALAGMVALRALDLTTPLNQFAAPV